MAAATVNHRFVTSIGPMKMEILNLTVAANGDEVESDLVDPRFCEAHRNVSGLANTEYSISGRTITITDSALSDSEVTLIVFGY